MIQKILRIPIITVSAPSGGGKATIVGAMQKIYSPIHIFPSATTRQPKEEKHGKKYLHYSHPEYENMIQAGLFAEYNKYPSDNKYGFNYYGTFKKTIDDFYELREANELGILEVDINGMKSLKKFRGDIFTTFLTTSYDTRKLWLKNRNSESPAEQLIRLQTGEEELLQAKELYDVGIINELVPYGIGSDIDLVANEIINFCF
jgi:guanylate kinase